MKKKKKILKKMNNIERTFFDGLTIIHKDKILKNPKKDNLFAFNDDGVVYDTLFFNCIHQDCKDMYYNINVIDADQQYPIQINVMDKSGEQSNNSTFMGQRLVITLYKPGFGPLEKVELRRSEQYTKIIKYPINNQENFENIININPIITDFLLSFL